MKLQALAAVVAMSIFSCWPCQAPVGITGFSPDKGLPGTIVEIQGWGFDADPFANQVTIGGSPVRVISGGATQLRVVALRDVATGPIEVQSSAGTAASSQDWVRDGETTFATPLRDSDSELVEGTGTFVSRRFDMAAQGNNQPILVVLAVPSDIDPEDLAPAGQTAKESVVDRVASANEFFKQASYGKTSGDFDPTPAWVPLSQIRDFYVWSQDDIDRAQTGVDAAQADLDALLLDPSATEEDIEDAEEDLEAEKAELRAAQNAVNKLQEPDFLFAEALLGAKAAVADFDDYGDYLVIVAGPFLRGQCCWQTTGFHAESTRLGLNFDIDFPAEKGLTYVAQEANWGRIAHELSHFFSGGDLYTQGSADGSVTEGNASSFAMMGSHNSHPLYIGSNLERRLDYFDESASGNVAFLEWGSTPDKDETFDLVPHGLTEDATGNGVFHLVKLKVGDGLSYYAEVRQQPDAAAGADQDYVFDPSIPLDPTNPAWRGGVIIFKAVENNNQSNNRERPVSLLPPARMLQAGEVFDDPARTIRISVEQKLADRPAKYRVRVQWGTLPAADPNGQFDLRITPWSPPPWETEDIWANSVKNDETAPAKIIYKNHEPGDDTLPIGNGDPPWVGHDNTLFARVTNQGAVDTLEAVKVTFYVNSPPGVGDNGSWAPFDTVDLGILGPNETRVVESNRKWRPNVDEHTCVKAEIHKMTGEITFENNQAQENFSEFETGAASPYAPIEFDFLARNPYDTPIVMDLRARNVPDQWFVAFDHGSVFLPPLGEKPAHVVIWTDRVPEWLEGSRKIARKPLIDIEGHVDRWADQVFAGGGITAFVQAVRRVRLEMKPTGERAVRQPFEVRGNVIPATGVAPIAVHVTDPDGKLITEQTATDAAGLLRYRTRYVADRPGTYRIQAFVLGGTLAGEAESQVFDVPVQ